MQVQNGGYIAGGLLAQPIEARRFMPAFRFGRTAERFSLIPLPLPS
jgi:hypothetical protein